MADALFDRYKDALRRGHVAALRGQLEKALNAYTEAATIAPERALPLNGMGTTLRRLGRDGEALAVFDRALERSAADIDALAGRADALVALGRRVDAAEAFVALAEVHDGAGRQTEAGDAARRSLELTEPPDRGRTVARIVGRIRGADMSDATRAVIARALRILEQPATTPATTDDAIASSADIVVVDSPSSGRRIAASEPADEDLGAGPGDPLERIAAADAAFDAGDPATALAAYREAVASLRVDGRWRVALDACSLALATSPTSGQLHLDLVELYLDAGWIALAADKVRLVGRLAELDEDHATRDRLCAVVRTHFGDDPSLMAFCS
ncbi:MAG: hypothetical protein AABZ33_10905 [Chloroflexota bacterium]